MSNEQQEWATKAAEHHSAFNTKQVVNIVTSAYHFKSEAAAFEIVRLMKLDGVTYGSCFRNSVVRQPKGSPYPEGQSVPKFIRQEKT
jgi:hypothetical protein